MGKIKVVRVSRFSKLPMRATQLSAGLDLFSCQKITIKSGDRHLVSTGIKISLPRYSYGRIASRSSLSINNQIDIGGEYDLILYVNF